MSTGTRSRLCPEHRSASIPTGSCVACAQARRIAILEQTIEQLTEHVAALEADDTPDEKADTPRESPPLPDGRL